MVFVAVHSRTQPSALSSSQCMCCRGSSYVRLSMWMSQLVPSFMGCLCMLDKLEDRIPVSLESFQDLWCVFLACLRQVLIEKP